MVSDKGRTTARTTMKDDSGNMMVVSCNKGPQKFKSFDGCGSNKGIWLYSHYD